MKTYLLWALCSTSFIFSLPKDNEPDKSSIPIGMIEVAPEYAEDEYVPDDSLCTADHCVLTRDEVDLLRCMCGIGSMCCLGGLAAIMHCIG